MEKNGEIRHDITPLETQKFVDELEKAGVDLKGSKNIPLEQLEEHLTKRAADAAKDKLSEDNPSN